MTSDIRYICGSVEEFAEAETLSGSPLFDIVCALEIVEHVVEPRTFLKSCAQLVRPGGLLFVSTLNRTPRSMALGVFGAEVVLGLVPAGTHDWAKFVKPVELQEYLEGAGESVKVSDICGLKMSLIDGSWYEDKGDTEVNYIVTASKSQQGKGTNEKEAGQGQGHGQKKKIDAMPDGGRHGSGEMQEYSAIVQRLYAANYKLHVKMGLDNMLALDEALGYPSKRRQNPRACSRDKWERFRLHEGSTRA